MRSSTSMMSKLADMEDLARLEELREIGKRAKTEAKDLDLESLNSTLTKAERKRQLAIAKTHKLILTKKKREILKEEEYLTDMDTIITGSFFPHYNNLKDQHDYLAAEDKNDHEKMRQISLKYRKRGRERPSTGAWTTGGTPLMTPSGFETPVSPKREADGGGSVKRETKPDLGINYDSDDSDAEEQQHEISEEEKAAAEKKKRTQGLSLDRYWNVFYILKNIV